MLAVVRPVLAQRTDWGGPWGVGVGLGTTSYMGDLNEPNGNRILIMPESLGFGAKGWFSKGFGPLDLILQLDLGRLNSRDYVNDEQFRANFYTYGAHIRVNMNKLLMGNRHRVEHWYIYLQGGIGMMRYSSYLTDMPMDTLINDVGYKSIGKAMSLAGAAGIVYKMTDEANVFVSVEYNMLNQDDIDAKIKGGSNDAYIFLNIGFNYTFGNVYVSGGRRKSLLWGKY